MTQTEWIAIISVVGTLASGALGSFVTYRITNRSIDEKAEEGKKQRDHDSRERELDRLHETSLKDQNRSQRRRLDAYVAIQSMVKAFDSYATDRLSGIGAPDQDSGTFPVIPDSTESLAQLIASDDIVDATNALYATGSTPRTAVAEARYWQTEQQNGKPGAFDDFTRSNETVKETARLALEAAENVNEGMRRELGGETGRLT